MPQSDFEPSLTAKTILIPITGETIFEFRNHTALSVCLVGNFRWMRQSIIPMRWQEDRWIVSLFLPPGCYEFGVVVDGVLHLTGVVKVDLDYRCLPDDVLQRVALTNTVLLPRTQVELKF
jgi:hypothetical protein